MNRRHYLVLPLLLLTYALGATVGRDGQWGLLLGAIVTLLIGWLVWYNIIGPCEAVSDTTPCRRRKGHLGPHEGQDWKRGGYSKSWPRKVSE